MSRLFWGIVFLAVFIAVGLLYAGRAQIYAVMVGLKLVPLEEPLTELYFNDTDTLPQTASKPLSFSFTINNLEGKDMTYPYIVSAKIVNGQRLILDQNTIPIAKGDAAKIPESFRPTLGARTIIVELPEQKEHILFLVR